MAGVPPMRNMFWHHVNWISNQMKRHEHKHQHRDEWNWTIQWESREQKNNSEGKRSRKKTQNSNRMGPKTKGQQQSTQNCVQCSLNGAWWWTIESIELIYHRRARYSANDSSASLFEKGKPQLVTSSLHSAGQLAMNEPTFDLPHLFFISQSLSLSLFHSPARSLFFFSSPSIRH